LALMMKERDVYDAFFLVEKVYPEFLNLLYNDDREGTTFDQ